MMKDRPACTCGVVGQENPHADDCAALIYSRRIFSENLDHYIDDRIADRLAAYQRGRIDGMIEVSGQVDARTGAEHALTSPTGEEETR